MNQTRSWPMDLQDYNQARHRHQHAQYGDLLGGRAAANRGVFIRGGTDGSAALMRGTGGRSVWPYYEKSQAYLRVCWQRESEQARLKDSALMRRCDSSRQVANLLQGNMLRGVEVRRPAKGTGHQRSGARYAADGKEPDLLTGGVGRTSRWWRLNCATSRQSYECSRGLCQADLIHAPSEPRPPSKGMGTGPCGGSQFHQFPGIHAGERKQTAEAETAAHALAVCIALYGERSREPTRFGSLANLDVAFAAQCRSGTRLAKKAVGVSGC